MPFLKIKKLDYGKIYNAYNRRRLHLPIPVRVKANRVCSIKSEQLPWRLITHPAITRGRPPN